MGGEVERLVGEELDRVGGREGSEGGARAAPEGGANDERRFPRIVDANRGAECVRCEQCVCVEQLAVLGLETGERVPGVVVDCDRLGVRVQRAVEHEPVVAHVVEPGKGERGRERRLARARRPDQYDRTVALRGGRRVEEQRGGRAVFHRGPIDEPRAPLEDGAGFRAIAHDCAAGRDPETPGVVVAFDVDGEARIFGGRCFRGAGREQFADPIGQGAGWAPNREVQTERRVERGAARGRIRAIADHQRARPSSGGGSLGSGWGAPWSSKSAGSAMKTRNSGWMTVLSRARMPKLEKPENAMMKTSSAPVQ